MVSIIQNKTKVRVMGREERLCPGFCGSAEVFEGAYPGIPCLLQSRATREKQSDEYTTVGLRTSRQLDYFASLLRNLGNLPSLLVIVGSRKSERTRLMKVQDSVIVLTERE
jgi:hypothetical protein